MYQKSYQNENIRDGNRVNDTISETGGMIMIEYSKSVQKCLK